VMVMGDGIVDRQSSIVTYYILDLDDTKLDWRRRMSKF
jgi:hypothetical protein